MVTGELKKLCQKKSTETSEISTCGKNKNKYGFRYKQIKAVIQSNSIDSGCEDFQCKNQPTNKE